MKALATRLSALALFRELLQDGVLKRLHAFLKQPSVEAYADFVAELYRAGGDLGAHVQTLCENSENAYVCRIGRGEEAPDYLFRALCAELDTLQEVARLDACTLKELLAEGDALPDFCSTKPALRENYLHRTRHISRYGYGIYATHRVFSLGEGGRITPVRHPDRTRLCDLVGYERERQILLDNTRALLAGKPAANILLTGDAGTGKSSGVKAVANELFEEGLRIVEVRVDQLSLLPGVLEELSENPLRFILFIDDLSFCEGDGDFNPLKAVLEGSVTAKAPNVAIYATGNRRHLVRETFSSREGDEVHRNDTMQELFSLSDRFGIHITFSRPDKKTYLEIVHSLAAARGLLLPKEELELLAERYALSRGGRSPRLARQFVEGLQSRL